MVPPARWFSVARDTLRLRVRPDHPGNRQPKPALRLGESTAKLPPIERKERLRSLFSREVRGLRFADHVVGDGPRFRQRACELGVEGVASKAWRRSGSTMLTPLARAAFGSS